MIYFEMPLWALWVLAGGGVLFILGLLVWVVRFTVVVTKTLREVRDLKPVIITLAQQFKNDDGSSALDILQHLFAASKEASAAAADAKVVAGDALRTANSLQHSVDILTLQQQRLEDVIQYATNKTTQTMNMIQAQPHSEIGQAGAGTGIQQTHTEPPPVKVIVVPDVPVPVQVVPTTEIQRDKT